MESEVPTFRGTQTDPWARYDPQELATPEVFRRNPRLVWDWYAWQRQLVNQAQPNPGHLALAELQQVFLRFKGWFLVYNRANAAFTGYKSKDRLKSPVLYWLGLYFLIIDANIFGLCCN